MHYQIGAAKTEKAVRNPNLSNNIQTSHFSQKSVDFKRKSSHSQKKKDEEGNDTPQ
jgi:hypothetical protein